MRLRPVIVVALVLCLLTLSACANPLSGIFGGSSTATSVASSTSRLSGSSWVLAQLHADGKNRTLVPTTPITLQFQQGDGTYIGSSGCNYYNGAYVVSGERLTFKFKSVTQVACVGPIMSQEVTYLNTMQQVRNYELSGHILTLRNRGDEVILIFTAA
ncbi:MAG TPA: META domain-containing protein [Ktedonobacterales bacterium]|nr:META domain-containing protein [Ktedonobacterales bacterium]